jgi:hypothetical protein
LPRRRILLPDFLHPAAWDGHRRELLIRPEENATYIRSSTSHEMHSESEQVLAKKKKQGIVNPTRLSPFDEEKKVQVIIETPKGSRNKYAWDQDQQLFALKKVLPEGMAFPHDFGFVPSTEAEVGAPSMFWS